MYSPQPRNNVVKCCVRPSQMRRFWHLYIQDGWRKPGVINPPPHPLYIMLPHHLAREVLREDLAAAIEMLHALRPPEAFSLVTLVAEIRMRLPYEVAKCQIHQVWRRRRQKRELAEC